MSFPRMSWHIGDYKKDTGHLRAAGHGAYFLLCMHYWATGGLPDDDLQLATIAGMTDREWKIIRPTMRAFFKGEGAWRHIRIDKELAAAQDKYEKRSSAGKKGGEAKANGKQTASNATAETYQPITDNPIPSEAAAADAREAPPLIRAEAFDLADDLARLCGHDPKILPTPFYGAPMRVESWLAHGWQREMILAAVKGVLAKRSGKPPDSVNYFEKPIAEFIAKAARPLPEVVIDNTPETVHVRSEKTKPGLVSATGDILDRMQAFDQPLGGSAGSEDPVRLLSKR